MPRRQPGVSKYQTKDGRRLWQYVVDLGPDPVSGKRRQRRKRGFVSQSDAVTALHEARRAIESGGQLLVVENLTFLQYMELWLDGLEHTKIKDRTRSDYKNETRRYIAPHAGDVKLQKLTPLHLEQLYRTLVERGGLNGKPLATKTVLGVHRVIRKALGDAERKGLIVGNPARLCDKPSTAQDDNERPAWTIEELQTFLKASKQQPLFPMFRLAALTGMRRGELCGVQWRDVDLQAMTVRVRQTLATINGSPQVASPKSRRSRRVIDVDAETVEVLQAHRKAQLAAADLVGPGWTETGYVFTTPIGTPQHPDNAGRAFTRFIKTLDVTYLGLHGLRHTHATHLLAAGVNPRVVSERLGHSDVSFTLQVYGHVLPGQQKAAASAVAALVAI